MIENKNGDFKLACYYCGGKSDLMQVAHRDRSGFIVGYLFLCGECLPIIGGNYSVYLEAVHAGKGEADI